MELLIFHDRIYGKYQNQLFTFETIWDSFRPISGIGWNGKHIVPIDEIYKLDLFDPYYGYGSREMKLLCKKLTQETELGDAKEIKDPVYLWRWYGEKNVKWWKDRPCVFTSDSISRETSSWKHYLKYLEVRSKTLRRPIIGRMTRKVPLKHLLSK